MEIDKCPDCGENVNPEDTFCPRCGLVFDDSPIYNTSGYDKNTGTYHEILNNGLDLEREMIQIELKHGYKSLAYMRFENFKKHYYDLFEEVLLENGYKLCEVPIIFYNHFRQWYQLNSKGKGNTNRVDVIQQFLKEFEV